MADFSSNYDPALAGQPGFGDLLMIDGDLVLTSDVDPRGTPPVLQDILFRLRTFQGEYFMDQSIGVPWYQQLLGHQGTPRTLDAVLQNVVLGTPGVLQLTRWSVSLVPGQRLLQLSFAAVTASGQVSYDSAVAIDAAGG